MIAPLLAFLFIASTIVEVSFFHTLPLPIAALPLTFLLGVLILHRGQLPFGVCWIGLTGIALSRLGFDAVQAVGYVPVALLAIPLTTRVFVRRSVYAMEGLGITLFLLLMIFHLIGALLTLNQTMSVREMLGRSAQDFVMTLPILMIGLYVAFLCALLLERWTRSSRVTRNIPGV